jgi:recombination protein RecA
MSDLNKAILEINKKFGENTIGKIADMPVIKTERISSGSPYLDWSIGGGWPRGRSIELYGPYSSGKSLIALRTIAEAQKQGLKCVYLDAENTFDPDFAEKIGVKMDEIIISQISSGEQVFNILDKLIESKDVAIIVIDTVASLVPEYEEQEGMEKQSMGLQARLMSKAMRKITAKAAKNKTLLLFINQLREKIGSYGNPFTTPGGNALKFYSSIRLEVRRGELLKDEKKIIGQQVKFKVTKSKVGPSFRDGYFMFYQPDPSAPDIELFDEADEIVSMLLLNKKIKRRGAYYDAVGKTFKGREELEREIRVNKDFRKQLEAL